MFVRFSSGYAAEQQATTVSGVLERELDGIASAHAEELLEALPEFAAAVEWPDESLRGSRADSLQSRTARPNLSSLSLPQPRHDFGCLLDHNSRRRTAKDLQWQRLWQVQRILRSFAPSYAGRLLRSRGSGGLRMTIQHSALNI